LKSSEWRSSIVPGDLPLGLETRVGERGIRSRRRAPARCDRTRVVSRSDLIVFDEATSSLDVVTEAK